ncbi:MAG: capsule biosynthesis protein, partial [Betaproteobacteria bacterium]|nr:capsule biosynthesis protein [Betaproteobacteria bacterium]
MKKMSALTKNKWFLAFVVLPTFLAIIYYGLFASDQYVSESRFIVKSQSRQTPQVSTLANLIQTSGLSIGQEQTNEVISFIKSRNSLELLNKKIDVRKKYQRDEADLLSRFPSPWRRDLFENLYRYYGDMVDAHTDSESGLAILSVRAFTPEDALTINRELLKASENLVNQLNETARVTAVSEAERRVVEAQNRVRSARLAIAEYRNRNELLDPAKQATGVLEVVNLLIAERVSLQAELDLMQRVAPRNPSIPALRTRIQTIDRQITLQTGRAVGTRNGIASKLTAYEKLAMEQEFSAQMLAASEASLEQARAEAQRQQFYLQLVVQPNKPDMPLYPRRLAKILTIMAAAIGLYMIGW